MKHYIAVKDAAHRIEIQEELLKFGKSFFGGIKEDSFVDYIFYEKEFSSLAYLSDKKPIEWKKQWLKDHSDEFEEISLEDAIIKFRERRVQPFREITLEEL